ncbi:hypothetical protein D3C78_1270310 [compost metagenome]
MSNRIPRKYQGVMYDLLQQHKGTGKRIELMTEKGVYTMQASKDSNSFVIEITDNNEDVEIEDAGSTEELREAVQDAVRETISNAIGRK